MSNAERALNAILMVGIEDEPEAALFAKAHTMVEMFKDHCAAGHGCSCGELIDPRVIEDLVMLRDMVDRELDRRLDDDLTDMVTNVLEDVCLYLHRVTGAPDCPRL
jgi:hypothetical protein